MDLMQSIALGIHIVAGFTVIGLVLLQHGKGADMGAAFGSGASGSLFGASGSANFLSRATAIVAAVFFVTSLGLSYLANSQPRASGSIMDAAKIEQPAVPVKSDVPVPAPLDSKAKDIPR